MATKRVEFVKEVQKLLRKTDCNDVTIQYGWIDYEKSYPYSSNPGIFVPSEIDVNTDTSKREVVLVKYDNQSDMFGAYAQIEMNGLLWTLKAIIETVDRL